MAWRTIARFARREGINCPSPRQAFRAAVKLGWIEDETIWLDMLEDRNRSSHTYDVIMADELYDRLPNYAAPLTGLLNTLRRLLESDNDLAQDRHED